jgi:hypothetical protein
LHPSSGPWAAPEHNRRAALLPARRRREDELSEPDSALLVTLIAPDGRAVLHRDAGAGSGGGFVAPPRGERGGADVLRVPAPAGFGAPAAVWLAPERGTWRVDALTLSYEEEAPARSGDGDDDDGDNRNAAAAQEASRPRRYLPVPAAPGAPPSGEGTGLELRPAEDRTAFAAPLSAAARAAARAASLAAYAALKRRLLGVTAALAAPGAAAAASLGGAHAAVPFAAGAAAGLLYLFLLEKGVDALPGPDDDAPPSTADGAAAPSSSSSPALGGTGAGARLALVALLAVAGARALSSGALSSGGGSADVASLRVELAAGAAGFLTYKLAVLLVGLSAPQEDAPAAAPESDADAMRDEGNAPPPPEA